MWIIYLCLSLSFMEFYITETIPQQMLDDNRISKFVKMLNSYEAFKSILTNEYLCILAPSDVAMGTATVTSNIENFVKSHVFVSKSRAFEDVLGTVDNWKTYESLDTKVGTIYIISSMMNTKIFMNVTTPTYPLVNGAQVIFKDNLMGKKVYHVIDRVLTQGSIETFQDTIKVTYTTSMQMWTNLKKMSDEALLNGLSYFTSKILGSTSYLTGTFLVPSNKAWESLTDADRIKLAFSQDLNKVLARMYISNMLVFVYGQDTNFKAGFTANPTKNGDGNVDGRYYNDSGMDMVTVEGYSARIIIANMPYQGGIIHIIDTPLFLKDTRDTYLKKYANTFYAEILKDNDLKAVLAGNNSVLGADDDTMAVINKMDAITKKQTLMNCFLIGTVSLATSNNAVLNTAGNATVRVKIVNGQVFLDTVASLEEKTYKSRVTLIRPENVIDGTVIYIVRGIISTATQSCSDMLQALDRGVYRTLVGNLPILLQLGSPYTLFVPGDSSITELTNATSRANETAVVGGGVTISSTNSSITSNTSISTTTVASSSQSPANRVVNVRYLLQRMIVANRLVLATRTSGLFKAATMNYAAMQEMIDLEIKPDSTITIGINGERITRSSLDDGFYCNSNEQTSADRLNLIYPVTAVLRTAKDSTTSICVVAPCAGCILTYARTLLLLSLGLLAIIYRRP